MDIQETFDQYADRYDSRRRMLIPCFDDFYHIGLSFTRWGASNPRILDLGAGTGLYAAAALDDYPDAQLTLIDLAPQMLARAEARFAGRPVTILHQDYTEVSFADASFDIILSGLSIHHLDAAQKEALYRNCFRWL
ncbi:MAG: class I SAM-dependent methyltransferase, partial [Clostridiales bacterium]|nr:class I SAM-dependent methyltransferase [Clostridiales bacterium]